MRIVFATAEVSPLAKTGGLGDVCGSLPKFLRRLGHDVVVFTPFYRQAHDYLTRTGGTVFPALPTTTISWGDWTAEATFLRATLPGSDVPLILVANDYFFNRDHLYSARLDGYDDSLERYAFFCRAVIRGCELLGLTPDIIHAHDWHTALLPVYLHSGLRGSDSFRQTRSVYTIHNLNYQGVAGLDRFVSLGLHDRYFAPDALEHFGVINPMKGGIIFADQVTTVSPNYGREIQTSEHGAGLDGVLRALSYKLTGILNGIDHEEWNPATDADLDANFDAGRMDGKATCKRVLVEESGLSWNEGTPLLAFISRLVDQKGIQLLLPILDRLLEAGGQAVILGSGEPHFEASLRRIGEQYSKDCRVWIGFDPHLARRLYAAADLLLMPSIYEPCGLNQMYALRYGTVPIVRLTGGLADSVIAYDGTNRQTANGFGFRSPTPFDLYIATWISMLNYKDGRIWKDLQRNGMQADFSWERSAMAYDHAYQKARAA